MDSLCHDRSNAPRGAGLRTAGPACSPRVVEASLTRARCSYSGCEPSTMWRLDLASMCGICGSTSDPDRVAVSAMCRGASPSRARRRRDLPQPDGRRRARRSAPQHHRPRGRTPAPRQRGRDGLDGLQRRDLQPPEPSGPPQGTRPRAPRARPTPRSFPISTRTTARIWSMRRGHVRVGDLGFARRERLLLARDRFGEKPLFYAQQGKDLVFASELTALVEGSEPRRTSSARRSMPSSSSATCPAAAGRSSRGSGSSHPATC